MVEIELFERTMSGFIWFRVEVSGDSFSLDVFEHMLMRMSLREVPILPARVCGLVDLEMQKIEYYLKILLGFKLYLESFIESDKLFLTFFKSNFCMQCERGIHIQFQIASHEN